MHARVPLPRRTLQVDPVAFEWPDRSSCGLVYRWPRGYECFFLQAHVPRPLVRPRSFPSSASAPSATAVPGAATPMATPTQRDGEGIHQPPSPGWCPPPSKAQGYMFLGSMGNERPTLLSIESSLRDMGA